MKISQFKYLSIICTLFTVHTAFSVEPNSTFGYFSLPNTIFPNNPPFSFGNSIQLTTAENNPDVWCSDQSNGYRTPKASDMNERHLSIVPPLAAPSSLSGNDERKASLSLYNEWGNVAQYPGSGWDEAQPSKKFWVAEPASSNERYVYSITDGNVVSSPVTTSSYVVCVADI